VNVYEYLLANARPTDTAIIAQHESVTYGKLVGMAEEVDQTLQRAGITRGQRVGILAENSAYWVACYLGVLKIGAVATPFPAWLSAEQVAHLIELTQTRAVCVEGARIWQYSEQLPEEPLIVTPGMTFPGQATHAGTLHVAAGCTPATLVAGAVAVEDRTDLAALMFTSGSTGAPNAVKISHRNIMANTASIVESLGLTKDDRMLVLLPFDYGFGLSLLHTHLHVGGTLVLNNASQFTEDDLDAILDDMERYACTGFAGVPATYQQLLRRSSLSRRTLPQLRHALQAGGKLADALIAECSAAQPHVRLFVMHTQTAATSPLSYLQSERLSDKLGSIGRGIPGIRLQVVDRVDRPVGPDEVGDLVAKGDNLSLSD
jgi:long-chain acyl-CoA synthetase